MSLIVHVSPLLLPVLPGWGIQVMRGAVKYRRFFVFENLLYGMNVFFLLKPKLVRQDSLIFCLVWHKGIQQSGSYFNWWIWTDSRVQRLYCFENHIKICIHSVTEESIKILLLITYSSRLCKLKCSFFLIPLTSRVIDWIAKFN